MKPVVYNAFISYPSTHRTEARDIHAYLEKFRVPRELVGTIGRFGTVPRSLGKVFLDRTDATGATDVRAELQQALGQSAALVVLCTASTGRPESWVDNEVADFKRQQPAAPTFAVILDGEPPACFPPALLARRTEDGTRALEPLAADFREVGDGVRDGRLKIVAALLGVPFDSLRRRHEEQERRKRTRIAAAICAYLLTITIGAVLVTRFAIDLSRSRSRALAENAGAVAAAGHFDTAALIALAALPPGNGAVLGPVPEAQAQLTRALAGNFLRRVIPAHRASVYSLDIHPQQPWVLSGAADGTVSITDWRRGSLVRTLAAHPTVVNAVAFSPDGSFAVTTDLDGGINIVSVMDGATVTTLKGIGEGISSIAFSPVGSHFVVGCEDGFAYVLDLPSGAVLSRSLHHEGDVLGAAFSPDGASVLTGSYSGRLILWNPADARVIRDFGRLGTIAHVGRTKIAWFVTFVIPNMVRLWYDGSTGHVDVDLGAPNGRLSLSSDQRFIASAHWDGTARVFDGLSWSSLGILRHGDWVDGAVFSADGRQIITADRRGHLNVWDNPAADWDRMFIQHGTATGPGALAVGQNGRNVYSGSFRGEVLTREKDDEPKQLRVDPACEAAQVSRDIVCGIRSLEISPDGRQLLVVTTAKHAELRDALTGESGGQLIVRDGIEAALFANDRTTIIAAGSQIGLVRQDTSGNVVERSELPGGVRVHGISREPNGEHVALATDHPYPIVGTPGLTLREKRTWAHTRSILSIAWSPDGQWLATGGADEYIRFGNPDREAPERSIRIGTWVMSAMFTADSRYLVVGGNDGRINILDVETGISVWERNVLFGGGSLDEVVVTPDNELLYYRTSLGWVGRLPLQLPATRDSPYGCGQLPQGRSAFTDAEMVEYPFLDASEQRPCERAGPFSAAFYRELMLSFFRSALPR